MGICEIVEPGATSRVATLAAESVGERGGTTGIRGWRGL